MIKKTIELVFLFFYKNTIKLVFLWPNMSQASKCKIYIFYVFKIDTRIKNSINYSNIKIIYPKLGYEGII